MLYQTLWCLPLPDNAALPLFHRLRDACRRATQQHPQLGVALLFSGSTVLLLAEGDAPGLAEVAQRLQAAGLDPAPAAAAAAANAIAVANTAAPPCPSPPSPRELAAGQCRVGYLDADDGQALGPTDSPATHKLAAFWRLWRGADRG